MYDNDGIDEKDNEILKERKTKKVQLKNKKIMKIAPGYSET